MPDVTTASIVVPSRGGANRLPTLFASLAAQSTDAWEAIVVLDGDIDNSASVVAEWSEIIPVRAIVFGENRGRAAALNAGFASAGGDVLIRSDDDLELSPGHVAGHIARHESAPLGVIGLCKNLLPPTPYAHAYGIASDRNLRKSAYASSTDSWRYWAANVSVRRELSDRIGDYDEGFRAYGVPVVIAEELEAIHHGAAATTATRAQRAFYSGAARHRFETKHGQAALGMPDSVGIWSSAVHGTASRLNERRVAKAGAAIDAVLPRLPTAIGLKAVALLVESAAIAGYSNRGETQRAI
jgi:glycosyltransferase involved in cell wall biosynthesis